MQCHWHRFETAEMQHWLECQYRAIWLMVHWIWFNPPIGPTFCQSHSIALHSTRFSVKGSIRPLVKLLLDKTTERLSGLPCKQVLHRPERAGITAFLLPIVQYSEYTVYTVSITLNIAFLGASVRFTQRKYFLFDDCWSTRPDLVCHFRRDTTLYQSIILFLSDMNADVHDVDALTDCGHQFSSQWSETAFHPWLV